MSRRSKRRHVRALQRASASRNCVHAISPQLGRPNTRLCLISLHRRCTRLQYIAVDCGKLRQIAPGGSVPSVSPSAIRHPPSAIRHPPSAIRHSPFAIFHFLSSIFYPLSSQPSTLPPPPPVTFSRVRSGTVAHGRLRSLFFFGFRVSFRPAVPICRAGVQRRRTWCFGFRKTRICA